MVQKKDSYPADYEEVFNLILSLIEQVRSDVKKEQPVSANELENYFMRLSKGTVGEYEFTRRMAFEDYPIIRIAAFPMLWMKYKQPVTPDFIAKIDNKLACIEVKNEVWKKFTKELIIKKNSLENCEKFKTFMGLDISCIAIKRFEKWYLLDTENYKKHAILKGNNYSAPIEKVCDENLLDEKLIVFDTGNQSRSVYSPPTNSKKEGVFYKNIKYSEDSKNIKLRYGHFKNQKELDFEGDQKEIIGIIFETIEKNFRNVLSNGYEHKDIDLIEDILPTKFSITDKLRDKYKIEEVDSKFNTLSQSGVIFIEDNKKTKYYLYRIACIIWHKYKEILKSQGIDFSEMKKLIPKLDEFRKTFK